jgi:hypothetical protein
MRTRKYILESRRGVRRGACGFRGRPLPSCSVRDRKVAALPEKDVQVRSRQDRPVGKNLAREPRMHVRRGLQFGVFSGHTSPLLREQPLYCYLWMLSILQVRRSEDAMREGLTKESLSLSPRTEF